jgi:hypothetical protein
MAGKKVIAFYIFFFRFYVENVKSKLPVISDIKIFSLANYKNTVSMFLY